MTVGNKKKLNLILHCGGKEVTRQELFDVETPEATKTHFPMAHGDFLSEIEDVIKNRDLEIISEAHGLSKGGNQYFGMLQIGRPDVSAEYDMVLGARNSHDKTLAEALALGTGTFVCDNLAFMSDVVVSHKHFKSLKDNLRPLIESAFETLDNQYVEQDKRFESYKEVELSREESSDFIIDLHMSGIISSPKIKKLVTEWKEPQHKEFKDRNLYSMFNCTTEILKGCNPFTLLAKTQDLYKLCDTKIPTTLHLGASNTRLAA